MERFHGAFTGGFSAGYFNTVGSEEGFQPQQFVSSKSNRANLKARTARDYMDENDQFLGGTLTAVEGVDTFVSKGTKDVISSIDRKGPIGVGEKVFADLNIRVDLSDTIGKRLMATMGWKVGHGIGPKIEKKLLHSNDEVKPVTESKLSLKDKLEICRQQHKLGFIPVPRRDENQRIEVPPPKYDYYGVGYINTSSIRDQSLTEFGGSGDPRIYRMSDISGKSTKRGLPATQAEGAPNKRAKAFSGYEGEDDEDDVYDEDRSFLYDKEAVEEDTESAQKSYDSSTLREEAINSWVDGSTINSGSSSLRDSSTAESSNQNCPSDGRPPLPGFQLATLLSREVPVYYPAPAVPVGFKPNGAACILGGVDRETRLSGIPKGKDPEGALSIRSSAWIDKASGTKETTVPAAAVTANSEERNRERPMLANPELLQSAAFLGLSQKFKSRFTSAVDQSVGSSSYSEAAVVKAGIATAAEFSSRLAEMKSNTKAPPEQHAELLADTVSKSALGKGSAGAAVVTRIVSTWKPSPLLCKRFNVKPPDVQEDSALSSRRLTGMEDVNDLISTTVSMQPTLYAVKPVESAENGQKHVEDPDLSVDIYVTPVQEKPSLEVFRSIFEDSSSEEEEDSGSEGEREGSNFIVEDTSTRAPIVNDPINNQDSIASSIAVPDTTSATIKFRSKRERLNENQVKKEANNSLARTALKVKNPSIQSEDDDSERELRGMKASHSTARSSSAVIGGLGGVRANDRRNRVNVLKQRLLSHGDSEDEN